METEFIPYEQALALNELGYDKPNIFFDNQLLYRNGNFCQANQDAIDVFKDWGDELVIALTFSQAFKWLYLKLDIKKGVMLLYSESQQLLLKELIDKMSSKHLLV